LKKDVELRALRYSLTLLRYRARSEREIKERLTNKKFPVKIVQQVMRILRKQGYIDDKKFAQLFLSDYISRGFGQIRVYEKLKQLGVSKKIITCTLVDKSEFDIKLSEIIESRLYADKNKRAVFKLVLHLKRKGFYLVDIYKQLSSMGVDIDEDIGVT